MPMYDEGSVAMPALIARLAAVAVGLAGSSFVVDAAHADDPEAIMKRSGCFRCHAVDREKVGPAYKDVAAKYRGAPDAEQRIFIHLTTRPKVKVDGQEEEHVAMTKVAEADIRAVARWILSR